MRQLAEWIVCALERRKATSVSDHKVYVYGFEAALYTLFSTAGLILIGSLLGRHIESLIIIAFFYTNQTFGGGFHASTHWKCFLTMATGLLCCLASFLVPFHLCAYLGLGAISLLLMFLYPLVLHQNRAYLQSKQDLFRTRSRIALLIQTACLIGVVIWGKQTYIQTICIALGGCALSRIIAVKK